MKKRAVAVVVVHTVASKVDTVKKLAVAVVAVLTVANKALVVGAERMVKRTAYAIK